MLLLELGNFGIDQLHFPACTSRIIFIVDLIISEFLTSVLHLDRFVDHIPSNLMLTPVHQDKALVTLVTTMRNQDCDTLAEEGIDIRDWLHKICPAERDEAIR